MPHACVIASLLLIAPLFTAIASAADPPIPDETAVVLKSLKVAPHETAIFVEDMHCPTCAKKVTSRLIRLKGVTRVRTNVKLDVAIVTPQAKKQLDAAVAWAALQAAGYQPTRLVGPQGTYIADAETKGPLKVAEAPSTRRK
jgi:copper chaperone CopZ